MPFVKGQSGNPKGRISKTISLTELLRVFISNANPKDEKKRSYRDCMIEQLAAKAATGDLWATREILDRTEGKAPQRIENSNPQPIVFTVVYQQRNERQLPDPAEDRAFQATAVHRLES